MKKVIFIILTLLINTIISAQPTSETIDIMYGSRIKFDEILSQDSVLVIDNWLVDQKNNKEELYILKKKNDKNNPFSSFSIKQSEIDNTYRYMYFIYGDDLMTIKVLKNRASLTIKIKKINFKKGTYIIDLQGMSKKYNEQYGIDINEFPMM